MDDLRKKIFSLLDLTSLNANDNEDTIKDLCLKANHAPIPVAAICIYPKFLKLAKEYLKCETTHLATVINFPNGTNELAEVIHEIDFALNEGAQELDVVFPYQAFLAGEIKTVENFMLAVRQACPNALLKVILETGAYPTAEKIYLASELCLAIGADFLKTSTGKIAQGASLEAAEVMLLAIKKQHHSAGLKISGGVRTTEQVMTYFALITELMGQDWISPQNFRIGASELYKNLFVFT